MIELIRYTLISLSLLSTQIIAAKTSDEVCPPGQHWVKAHFRRAYVRADGTPVSAANVRAHCKANPPGYSTWKERLKSDTSERWIRRKEKPKKWTLEEEERMFDALSALPPTLLVESVRAIYRLEKSSLFDQNPASGEPGGIAVYDKAFEKKANLARILAHEFAHELYRQLSDAEKDQYRIVAEWLLVRNPRSGDYRLVPNRVDADYVEKDGLDSMTEDFSNNIEYFLFDSKTLQQKSPKVHEWIRKKFGDNFKVVKAR